MAGLGADGKGSQIRALAGLTSYGWRYPQDAIVTTVEHDRDHGGLAHEYFLPSGPFAILPLTGKRSSIVWTEKRSRASAFMELPDALFTDELASRFGDHLGRVKPFGPRFRYPLALQFAPDYARPRLALIGDAAHVIHPIAGQGLNMGLRDIAALAEVLTGAKRLGLDIGALDVLRRYQQWRRFDNVTLGVVTDTLNRLFANDFPPIRLARGLGLGAVGLSRPLRQFFMRHAMGQVGELPRLLKGELP